MGGAALPRRTSSCLGARFERHNNVPASLADACLIRMSELYDDGLVLTLDSDFEVYRRHGRKKIAVLRPG
jgi:uncharacterized protein